MPIGLGARDSLRLEARLCLYGHDIDTTTTPVEAALEWSVQKSRRTGGAAPVASPARRRSLLISMAAPRRRVDLRPEGRAPVREGAPLFADAASIFCEAIGTVTSGGFGPSCECADGDGLCAHEPERARHKASSPKCAAKGCRSSSPQCHS